MPDSSADELDLIAAELYALPPGEFTAARNALAKESVVFDQEAPETLWCGRREAAMVISRDPATLSPPAARLAAPRRPSRTRRPS